MRSFRDLIVWQRALQLSVGVYELTRGFPKEEIYGLTSQLRRASVSAVSNIAEGHGRGSRVQLMHFLQIPRGSAFEIQAQLILANQIGFGDQQKSQQCQSLCEEVKRMLYATLESLRQKLVAERTQPQARPSCSISDL